MITDPVKLLRTVADFFEEHPEGWCKFALARDNNGYECSIDSPDAVQWCVGGKLAQLGGSLLTIEVARGTMVEINNTQGREAIIAWCRERASELETA